jgi:arginyl-tRNA--protein-N-Asp/Glu arginylyltransferase
MELKGFCTAKEMVTRLKRQPQNGENLCQYIPDKGLITRIYRELNKLNSQRINDPMKKWAFELNRKFSKKVTVQMAKKCLRKCLTTLVVS